MRIETLLERFNPGRPVWWNVTLIVATVSISLLAALKGNPLMVVLVSIGVCIAADRLEPRVWAKFMAWWKNDMPMK